MGILKLECEGCGEIYSSGISMAKETFETAELSRNTHQCPSCGMMTTVDKDSYIFTE